MDFAVPADHRIKLKESDKKDKYVDLAWELKKLCNIKVTVLLPLVIGALGSVIKGCVQGLEDLEITGRVETIQTTASLRSARFGLVWFYGIPTFVGYLTPNPFSCK